MTACWTAWCLRGAFFFFFPSPLCILLSQDVASCNLPQQQQARRNAVGSRSRSPLHRLMFSWWLVAVQTTACLWPKGHEGRRGDVHFSGLSSPRCSGWTSELFLGEGGMKKKKKR